MGLAVNPKTDTVWVTVNGRDMLGDDIPPETIYDLGKGGVDAGWPYCYETASPIRNSPRLATTAAQSVIEPKVQMQAHSAPLGLAFYEGKMFPADYRNNIYVAFHGSWNRSVPTGYKVVRVKLDDKGQPVAERRLHHRMAGARRDQERPLDGKTGRHRLRCRWIDVPER